MDEREHLRSLLDRSLIAVPLLNNLNNTGAGPAEDATVAVVLHPVVIDLNLGYEGGTTKAAERVRELIAGLVEGGTAVDGEGVVEDRSPDGSQYLVARLTADTIRSLAGADRKAGRRSRAKQAIYRIWPDFPVRPHTTRSVATVKVDAARATFAAWGDGIVWAVLDSGIDGKHPHFREFHNLDVAAPLAHKDFTGGGSPLTDEYGHGTHVAGILAGHAKGTRSRPLTGARRVLDETGDVSYEELKIAEIAGMAPRCKLLSYKVLNETGGGDTSAILTALQEINKLNEYGRAIKIHGVNLSVGYPFDPEWFACGYSPLCTEVERLVASGVVVVVSAGNTGYGLNLDSEGDASQPAGVDLTINDPGNAESAITVGATHRESPHRYGVSFFSSKGPTGDGRLKPDLVAPGEKILAPAAGRLLDPANGAHWDYAEDTGTSMAAPHVSGAIAAFLSVRGEFIGRPDLVKQIFTDAAVDLKREPHFQGHGLLDLLRALQSV